LEQDEPTVKKIKKIKKKKGQVQSVQEPMHNSVYINFPGGSKKDSASAILGH
jgi:hypothetical protein